MATLIAALGPNNMLGRADGTLAWHEPCDMALFLEHTKNKSLVVGYRTYMGLPPAMLRRGSFNVITDEARLHAARSYIKLQHTGGVEPCVWAGVNKIPSLMEDRYCVIGGAAIYNEVLTKHHKCISEVIITHIRDPRCKFGSKVLSKSDDVRFPAMAMEYLVHKFEISTTFDISDRVGLMIWRRK